MPAHSVNSVHSVIGPQADRISVGSVLVVDGTRFVAWQRDGRGWSGFQLRVHNTTRLRSDVRVDEPDELASMMLPSSSPWLVRCRTPEPIAGGTVIGMCPAGVMARIATAVRRELEARRTEGEHWDVAVA